MEIPVKVVRAFKTSKVAKEKNHCPLGCDPEKTKVAVSKPSRKKPGRFVSVYYRKQIKVSNVVDSSSENNRQPFWSELYDRSERSSNR